MIPSGRIFQSPIYMIPAKVFTFTFKFTPIRQGGKMCRLFNRPTPIIPPTQEPYIPTFEFEENIIIKGGIRRIKVLVNLFTGFGPVIDFSNSSKLNKEEKIYLRDFAKTLSKELNIECDPNGYNDFREWDRVKEFAHRFAGLVKGKDN